MLALGKMKFGCFSAAIRCDKCHKLVYRRNFDYLRDHVGVGDTDELKKLLTADMKKEEINFCCKCGHSLFKEAT